MKSHRGVRTRTYFCLLLLSLTSSAIAGTQYGAPWGLDRIDQRTGLDNTYRYDYDGSNTVIYVVDDGVAEIGDLGGRILSHRHPTFVNQDLNYDASATARVHGTRVASIAAGTTYGVAKGAYVVDMRVFSFDKRCVPPQPCEEVVSTRCLLPNGSPAECAIAAFEEIAATHNSIYPGLKGVVNFSGEINVGANDPDHIGAAMRDAVSHLIEHGLTVVVAATEFGATACDSDPTKPTHTPVNLGNLYDGLITVSAIEIDDRLADDNGALAGTGPCVDLFAPSTVPTATGEFRHTSSATPFVSGAAALAYHQSSALAPAEVEVLLKRNATRDVLGNIPANTVNALLYTRFRVVSVSSAPPPIVPGQLFTASVTPVSGASYQWSVVNGTIIGSSTGSTVQFKVGCPGETTISVAVTASDGQSYGSGTVTGIIPSTARVSGSTTINFGQSATLSLVFTGTAPWTVVWQDGVQQTYSSYNATRTVTPSETTTYRFLSVRDGAGCSGNVSGSATITVNGGCAAPDTTMSTPSVSFSSGELFASVPPTQGATYSWSVTNGWVLSGQGTRQIQYRVGCSGTTTVSVTVTPACGSPASASRSVAITPASAVVSGSQTIYSGQTAVIQATYNGNPGGWITWSDWEGQYNLYPGQVVFREVAPSSTTTYTVIEVRDNRGCFGTASGSATVTVQ